MFFMLFPEEIEADAVDSLYYFDRVYNGWDACFDHVRSSGGTTYWSTKFKLSFVNVS